MPTLLLPKSKELMKVGGKGREAKMARSVALDGGVDALDEHPRGRPADRACHQRQHQGYQALHSEEEARVARVETGNRSDRCYVRCPVDPPGPHCQRLVHEQRGNRN